MRRNVVLLEAVDTLTAKPNEIASSIKKTMNVCKLTKFRSQDKCAQFFSAFFLCGLENGISPTVEQWGTIYTTLLSDDAFCGDLAQYMVCYQPAIYTGMFAPLWSLVQSELAQMKENKIRYLSQVKALFTMIQTRTDGVGNLVKSQVNDMNVLKFVTVVNQTLSKYIFDLNTLVQEELTKSVKAEDVVFVSKAEAPMSEAAVEFLELLEDADSWVLTRRNEIVNESIVRDAAEKAKSIRVAQKKAENEFDEFVMKKVKKMREERRNRKHSEMVGESLRLNHEIKRLLRTGGIAILSPTLAAITFIVSVIYDRATDKRDRQVLVGQLKDELEIVEEKIQMAERNGDEKARIELIRFRQKLQREYERITRMRWDAQTRARMGNS